MFKNILSRYEILLVQQITEELPMAWSKQHKINTKDNILKSAAALFTRHGYDKVSINQVMQKANLTRGAFYAHFKSKSELYAQALIIAGKLAKADQQKVNGNAFSNITSRYLSPEHRDEELQNLCPLAFLVTDINQQNEIVKTTYTDVFKGFVTHTNTQMDNRQQALQASVLMIGGLALAKAVNDKKLSDELMNACKQGVHALLDEQ